MVEWYNCLLLQRLRTYVEEESDWERFLPLVLHAYLTSVHSSTGVSPFMLMFVREPKCPDFEGHDTAACDPTSYQAQITYKMAKLQDFVETHLVDSASKQHTFYNKHSHSRHCQFKLGDCIWLSIPTAGKLQPKWEGGWKVAKVISPINLKIHDGKRTRVVHINRVRHRFQPALEEVQNQTSPPWTPPLIEHSIVPCDDPVSSHHNPSRIRHPPDYFWQ